MTHEQIVLLCTVGGAIGGAVGAAFGFLVMIKVTIAVQGAKLREQDGWIKSLRRARHRHSDLLQKHENKLSTMQMLINKFVTR